jgi:hypothetical protein
LGDISSHYKSGNKIHPYKYTLKGGKKQEKADLPLLFGFTFFREDMEKVKNFPNMQEATVKTVA